MSATNVECQLCHQAMPRTDHGRETCTVCEHGMLVDLAAIVDAAAIAAYTPEPMASQSSTQTSRPKPGSRPPVSLAHIDPALTSIDEIRGDHSTETTVLALLESWISAWRKYRHLVRWGGIKPDLDQPVPSQTTLAAVCNDLRRWLPTIVATPDFPSEELQEHIRRCLGALRALDPAREISTALRVPCPSDADPEGTQTPQMAEQGSPGMDGSTGGAKPSTVVTADVSEACGLRLTVDPEDLHRDIRCPRCGTTWTAQRLLLVALSDPRVTIWAYPSDITGALGIPGRELRRWAESGIVPRMSSRYDTGAAFRHAHQLTHVRA